MKRLSLRLILACSSLLLAAIPAHATLTVSPITWNIIGLDSNSPTAGPKRFPVGARVCSNVATTNVAVNFVFDSANANINLRAGSLSTINFASIGAGQCSDAYFEAEVTQVAAAYDTTRRYHITATDTTGTVSTPTPRELYVEHLISQNRNSITDVKYGPNISSLTSVPAGGSMNLVVGNTYTIQLLGGTATQGYNQFEAFINFPNTIFQILAVNTTYSADSSPFVANPSDKLYADACGWESDPNSPNYRACVGGDFDAGGQNVVTTYTIKIISGGGTSQTLGSLLYDFSGSSFHYNADFTTGARIANIIDPTTSTISKSFSPNPVSVNGVTALQITLTNPNAGAVSGYNFVDNLPANLVVASTPNATTSGCGTPTLTANAGASSITFSNGTIAANGNCVIKVNVTPSATGTLTNNTNDLFIDTNDTGHAAAASLTVNSAPPPGTGLCGVTLANWTVPNGTTANPPDLTGGLPTVKASNVATATLAANVPGDASILTTSGENDSTSWRTFGYKSAGQFIQFTLDTTNYTGVQMSFWVANPSPANGPTSVTVTVNGGSGFGSPVLTITNPALAFTQHTIDLTGLTNTSGNTLIRITATGANNDASGASLNYDNIAFTGCTPAAKPTIAKAFSPSSIAVNATSTLTFTLTNTNTAALTSAAFSDSLPSGVQVASTPSASTTCGGTWAPAAGNTTLTFSGGTIPASGSCTVSVNVTATTSGPHANVSGTLSTTEAGTSTSSIATATLTALLPPSIAKEFLDSPIIPNGTSILSFTITNPNENDAISGVAFNDTFPTSPGSMVVAGTPNATTSGCGTPVFSPAASAGSISFSGGSIAAGGTCVVTVDITAPATGTYNNTSGNVSYVINSATVNGNTASGSLTVNPPNPAIHLLKEVNSSGSGLFFPYLATPVGGNVFYKFTAENTGDVAITSPQLTDNTVDVSSCNASWSGLTLQPGDTATCVVGPITAVSGSHTNTASVSATYNSAPVTSANSSATYATTALSLTKSATESSFTLPGDVLHYSYLVSNTGFATLTGPVTVTDDHTTVTCPAVNTVGDLDDFFDPGESMTCTATYTITPSDVAAAHVTNTASAQTADGTTSNTSSKTVPLSTSADVSMNKTLVTAGPYFAGSSISYTLVVANAGPSTATSIQVTDTPTNLTITNVSGSGCSALPCTIASLASGANTTINVTATINAAGAFDNSATATATQPDPNTANNTDNTGNGGTATSSADVSISKALVTSGPFVAGESITYSIVVANAGPSTATNVQVTDTPTNMTITSVSGGGCSAFPCTIASLASGANVTITASATITAAGAFDNSATVSATEPDPNLSNNTDSTGNGGTAAASADVSIDKTLTTSGPYVVAESITYTLTVANAGPSPATNIQVTDTPTNLTITNVSGSGCSALPCTIGSLPVGANTTITVTATINSAGVFDNSATATGTESDPNLTNNTDNTGNGGTASASADVSMNKTLVTAGPFIPGESISYTLVVANGGPSTATNIQVTDTPTNLTITNVSGSGCSALPCTIATLASGANTTINVTATINSAGVFDNSATATATESDPNPTNNTDNTGNGGTASPIADVSMDKTLVTTGPYTAGESISYTLVVANAGPSTATNIQVTDTPTNLTITNVNGSGCSALPCTIPSLASGANTTINVTATIDAAGAFDNSATAMATESDPNTANNTDNTGNGGTAAASADVSIDKSLTTAGPYVIGESITYSITVANAGPSPATNISVTDTPTNLTITNVSGACTSLPCTIGSLASGANTSMTVTATINAVGAFDNSATATPTESDPNLANNTDNTGNGGTAAASADVSIDKTLTTAGPYVAAESITYSLVVANAGPSTATNVQVTDTPTNLTITNVNGGGCSALPCTIASLASGSNVTITVTATINATGAFDNSATVSATEFDPNTANNTDSTGNGGTAGASADVSINKTLVTTGPYTAGESISYTLVVANGGPSTATNIQVTDTPTNMTITNVSGSGCSALPCTIASLAASANTTINVTATITAAGAFDNSATATATEFDPNTANNTDNTGNGGTAAASADVSIDKTLTTSGPYVAGESITYSITVANAGPSTATNISVTDTPTNLTITNVSGACSSLPCTIGSLASGANTSMTVTATIVAAGAFDNSATATPTESDPNLANNTDSTGNGGTAAPSADVSMNKTLVTAGPYIPGESISYTLVVANAGPSDATNVQVTDTPTNLTITNVNGGGCSSLPCTIASLTSGSSVTINVTATINAAGAFDNSATATGTESDPNTGNNTDNTGNGGTAAASADVSMNKTLVTAGPYTAGESISYTLVVANAGPSPATNIQVTDTPTNLTITNVSGACTALPCTIASLANGANATINVTATIVAAGAFDNSATATATESDPNTGNNTDNTGNGGTAAASADVSVNKTLTTSGPYFAGESIAFSIVIANGGPSTATNISVTDSPFNLTITNVSGACSALPCTIGSLASGANVTIDVTATIIASGDFSNSATATPTESDPNLGNNTSPAGSVAAPAANVSMNKTLNTSGPFFPGQSVSYTLTIANAGPSTATNISVTDTPTNLTITNVSGACSALPCTIASLASGASVTINVTATINAAGAFNNSATATATEFDPDTSNNTSAAGSSAGTEADVSMNKTLTTAGPFRAGQSISYTLVVANAGPSTATNISVTDTPTNLTITNVSGACTALPCTIASLASGANVTINVSATIVAAGAFDNSATATAAEFDPNTSNNTDNTGNGGTAAASADVSMNKTLITAGPFTAGESIAYTLVVANAGPSPATNISVTDTPANMTITTVSGACSALPCTIGSLPNGASVTINVTAKIVAAGAFDNSATATPTESDPNLANNTDNTGNGGTAGPAGATVDLAITKTASASSVIIGHNLDFTLTVVNNGPATATGVTVNDPLPPNFSLISATPSQGTCSGTTTVTCSLGTLANGATATVVLHGFVNSPASLSNTATVSSNESDTRLSNNTSTAAVTVQATNNIPTVSEYGLMLLAALLGLAGVFVTKSRM